MEKKQFQAESKRLLDLMINSIYTHKEIFLRELISNASDAIDKLYFKSLSEEIGKNRNEFAISIIPDKQNRALTIRDNGIGMSKEELENNLGIIANSGSFNFKSENKADDINIIGQFGVGFYSAFMIAKEVIVKSKAFGSETAYEWKSEGTDGYTIDETEKSDFGTEITLVFKEDTEDEKYSDYLEGWRLQNLIKKYSDYIRYPITLPVTENVPVEHEHDENCDHDHEDFAENYEEVTTIKTINSLVPLWKKNKNELTDEDYNQFYKDKFSEYTDPLARSHVKNEGTVSYDALLYIPSKAPYNYYSKDFEKGLQLYSNGVMIMQKCKDLLPDYFGFVKGLVDSEDFSLNISREILQHDRQLKLIAKNIEKTIKNELIKLLKNDREKYEEFFKEFGTQLKYGIYEGFGANKDTLKDLVLFHSSSEKKLVSLAEYKGRMKPEQEFIYYAAGKSVDAIDVSPKTEAVKSKDYEILYLTADVDEFALKVLVEYDGKQFKSVSSSDLKLETEEEKKATEEKSKEFKDVFEEMKKHLAGKVSDVRLSSRLKEHPVCLASDGEISVEMQEILKQMPGANIGMTPAPILEINPNHPIFTKLQNLYENDKEKLGDYADILLGGAKLIEGFSLDNPSEFADKIVKLM
ncbi:chaperone protein HtpG [Clostridia bacterium]|nr:chaperone protein HtpG [Clostridia bacterium]